MQKDMCISLIRDLHHLTTSRVMYACKHGKKCNTCLFKIQLELIIVGMTRKRLPPTGGPRLVGIGDLPMHKRHSSQEVLGGHEAKVTEVVVKGALTVSE